MAYGVPLTLEKAMLRAWDQVLFRQPVAMRAYGNSLLLAGSAALILMVVAAAGLVDGPQARLGDPCTGCGDDLPYALPGVVLTIAGILSFLRIPFINLTLYGTLTITLLTYLSRFLVVMLRPVQASVGQLDPAMEEAAASSGAGLGRRLRTIFRHLAAPAAAAGAILVFLDCRERTDLSAGSGPPGPRRCASSSSTLRIAARR